MSVIIDATMSEVESVIKYARYGANNCMIGNGWEIKELVRCKDCRYLSHDKIAPEFNRVCIKFGAGKPDYGFCDEGEREGNEDCN